jgi:lysyl-tRNA synthetase, class I
MDAVLVVPRSMDAILERFDQATTPLDEHEVKQALVEARKALVEPSAPENLGAWAEVLAFALSGSARHRRSSPWNTFYGPVATGTNADGTPFYSPDIAGTDAEVVSHWTRRANILAHPVLKARYADLAWDMSRAIANVRPDPDMARSAIDAYLASRTESIRSGVHDRFGAVLRALDLAVMIRDPPRIEAARSALLELHRQAVSAGKGLWWNAIDRLIANKRAGVTDAEREGLVSDLEGIVARHSDASASGVFDPHATEDAARRLIKHYTKLGSGEDVRRLHEVIARAFEHFASLADATVASAVLQMATNSYRAAGLQAESQRTRVVMQGKIAESRDQMVPISIERTIPKDDMDRFVASVVVSDLGGTFVRIASSFLQSRSELEKEVAESLRQAPLMATIPRSIIADDHVAATVGSVTDDPFGRLIQHAAQAIALSDIWLIKALDQAIVVHDITTEHIVTWAARNGLFRDLTLLSEGVEAWYDQDFVKAVHVLVPQVEVGLRGVVAKLGKPVTKPHSTIAGVSVAIGMGDILYSREITELLGPDLTLHFLVMYADPRGFNLRNDVAHGLIRVDQIHYPLATRVIHTLLVFGIWEALAKIRR